MGFEDPTDPDLDSNECILADGAGVGIYPTNEISSAVFLGIIACVF